MAAMLPIFVLGLVVGFGVGYAVAMAKLDIPSTAKFKIQEEQLKNAQIDLQTFELELEKAHEEIARLKEKQAKQSRRPRQPRQPKQTKPKKEV